MFKIKLNLFDTQVTTQESLSAEMKTYYDMRLIDMASPNLVHDQFGQKRPIPANGGKTIEFRKFSSLPKALAPLTEGVTPSGNSLTVTNITATVRQYGDYIVQSDVLELTALDNTILEATKLLGSQAGKTIDTVVRDIINAGTNVSFASKWSGTTETAVTKRIEIDTTAVLKVDTIEKAVAKMSSNNAPKINGDYVCIIHPNVAYDLRRDPDWIEAHKYAAPEELYNGEIGKIAGVRFVESSEAKIWNGENLAGTTRNLAVNGAITAASATKEITFDGGSVETNALKDRYILVGGKQYKVASNTTTKITVDSESTLPDISDNTVIYPGEGGAEGIAVYSCLLIGEGAYGTTDIAGGGLQTIIKQKGSAGTSDPLDQRSSVGWKALKTAEILVPEYLLRIECTSKFNSTPAN